MLKSKKTVAEFRRARGNDLVYFFENAEGADIAITKHLWQEGQDRAFVVLHDGKPGLFISVVGTILWAAMRPGISSMWLRSVRRAWPEIRERLGTPEWYALVDHRFHAFAKFFGFLAVKPGTLPTIQGYQAMIPQPLKRVLWTPKRVMVNGI